MDNNNEKLIDKSYVADSEHIKENSAAKSNEEMVNKLNQPAIHSPNSNLHKNPLPKTSGLSASNNKAKNDIKNATNNSSFEANRRAQLNNIANNKGLVNSLNKAKLSNAKAQNNTVNSLESAKQKKNAAKTQSLAGRVFDLLTGNKALKKIKETSDGGGSVSISTEQVKKTVLITILGPVLVFFLIVFISIFVIYTILTNMGLNADDIIDSSIDVIEEKLNNDDDATIDDATEKIENKDLSFATLNVENSIYSIKINNTVLLAKSTNEKNAKEDFDFDIKAISDLYPPAAEYADIDYSYAFFYKLYRLNESYKSQCGGKQVLDLPLLIITLKLESDDMAKVFASNLGYMGKITKTEIDMLFPDDYFDYYYNWGDYEYSRYNSIHDMEILAQHMIEKTGSTRCKYDEDKYNEFLKEFIEKKYYLNDSSTETSINSKSSNYFPRYNLTEDQLLQIASLCQQEQPGVSGAAAEASLMANKFETEGSTAKNKYKDNPADGLYYYIKNNTWWNSGALVMNRRNASPEIVEAVRDVLVNGNRTLPKYVNSHDCLSCNQKNKCPNGKKGDICIIKNDRLRQTQQSVINNHSNYIPHVTQVANVYDLNAFKTFYTFPNELSDPFSYKSQKLRDQYGECHYDLNNKTFVECTDMKEVFVSWLIEIAEDNKYGYSQTNRDSLMDFDSSSLIYQGLLKIGFTSSELGVNIFTTATEPEVLKRVGFKEIEINSDLSQLQMGDILWRDGHTEVYIGEGMTVGAHSASDGTTDDGLFGDQNGNEISIVNIVPGDYWQYAYRYEG